MHAWISRNGTRKRLAVQGNGRSSWRSGKRRLAWFKQHGSIDDGWTPPDPKDPRRTAYRPLHAYLAHQGLTVETAYAKYSKFDTSHFQTKHHLEVLARLWNWDVMLKPGRGFRGRGRARALRSTFPAPRPRRPDREEFYF